MRVLLLSPLPPPNGGIASWTLNLMGYSSLRFPGFGILQQDTGLKYRNIFRNDFFARIYFGIHEVLRILKELKKNIKYHSPDIIHLTSSASLALFKDYFVLKIANKKKIPLVMHWHFGRIPALSLLCNWEWKLLGHIIKGSQTSIVIDPQSYHTLISRNFSNIVYVPNPISIDLEHKIINSLSLINRRIPNHLIFVGHVIENKGILELVEALAQIPLFHELAIVGPSESSMIEELNIMAKKKDNGEWLKFYGELSNDLVLKHVRESAILVLPSYTEGFPIVVLEAMAMGCAVIATEVGAIPEMLAISSDNPCGICVPVRNIELLRNAIISLLADPEKARLMGENGKERVLNNYSLRNVMMQYKSVWDNAIQS
jgi:glycosyltransferase involved in cell wall biosynthesis